MMQSMGMPGAPMFPPQAAAHAQMVFTTTQRPQPKIGGQQTRTYNILPMISFKVCTIEDGELTLLRVAKAGVVSSEAATVGTAFLWLCVVRPKSFTPPNVSY